MGEPWLKYGSFKEPQSTGVGPWSKYGAKAAPEQNTPVASDMGPQTVNAAGKGDMGLGAGEVAPMTYVEDAGRSLATGVRRGVEGLAGMQGDLADLSARGVAYLTGMDGDMMSKMARMRPTLTPFGSRLDVAPTTSEIGQKTDRLIGTGYEPQTTVGEYSKTVGEFAPAALTGPGGAVRKTAMTVIPAVASETAGQATDGTSAEPYARLGGALIGGGVAAGAKTTSNAKLLRQEAKTTKNLVADSKDAYAVADAAMSKAQVPLKDFGQLLRNVNNDAAKRGFDGAMSKTIRGQHSKSATALDDMRQLFGDVRSGNTPSPTMYDIEQYRKTLGQIAQESVDLKGHMNADGQFAQQMQRHLDDIVSNSPYKEAREAYKLRRKTERVEHALEMAKQRGSSEEQAIKNEFRKIVRENKKTKTFSNEEIAYINRVANHSSASNVLEAVGRMGFGSKSAFAGTAASGVGFALGGIPAAVATAAVTSGAKKIGAKMTQGRAQVARDFVASGNSKELRRKLVLEARNRNTRRVIASGQSSRELSE